MTIDHWDRVVNPWTLYCGPPLKPEASNDFQFHLFCWIVKVLVWDRKVSKLAVVPWASWTRTWSHPEKELNKQIWKEVCSRVCSSPLGWWLVGQAWRALRSPHLRLLQPQVQAKQWAPKRSQPCASVKRFDCFPHKLLFSPPFLEVLFQSIP